MKTEVTISVMFCIPLHIVFQEIVWAYDSAFVLKVQ